MIWWIWIIAFWWILMEKYWWIVMYDTCWMLWMADRLHGWSRWYMNLLIDDGWFTGMQIHLWILMSTHSYLNMFAVYVEGKGAKDGYPAAQHSAGGRLADKKDNSLELLLPLKRSQNRGLFSTPHSPGWPEGYSLFRKKNMLQAATFNYKVIEILDTWWYASVEILNMVDVPSREYRAEFISIYLYLMFDVISCFFVVSEMCWSNSFVFR